MYLCAVCYANIFDMTQSVFSASHCLETLSTQKERISLVLVSAETCLMVYMLFQRLLHTDYLLCCSGNNRISMDFDSTKIARFK